MRRWRRCPGVVFIVVDAHAAVMTHVYRKQSELKVDLIV